MNTNPYDIFRTGSDEYVPHTPQAALVAYARNLINDERFIHRCVSVAPLNCEPYDLPEIERVLARKNLDFATLESLIPILREIIRDPDRERAQIAAENLTAIESRYTQRIQGAKTLLEVEEPGPRRVQLLRRLIDDIIDFALINKHQRLLKNFYLREANGYSRMLRKEAGLEEEDILRRLRIYDEFGLHSQALSFLRTPEIRQACSQDCFERAEAAILFRRGEYRAVIRAVSRAQPGSELESFQKFWLYGREQA